MPTTFPVSSATFVDTAYLNAYGARKLASISQASTATIQLSSIPQTYKHLLVTWRARSNVAAVSDLLGMRWNTDLSNHYIGTALAGAGATLTASEWNTVAGDVMSYIGGIPGASAGANNSTGGWVFIPDYTDVTNTYQRYHAVCGGSYNFTTGNVVTYFADGQWYPSPWTSVGSLTFLPKNGTAFVTSSFTLYGMG